MLTSDQLRAARASGSDHMTEQTEVVTADTARATLPNSLEERTELIDSLLISRRNALSNAEIVAAQHPEMHLLQQTWREISASIEQQLAELGYMVADRF